MLEFRESDHKYFWNSQPVPHITGIMDGMLSDLSKIPPAVLERKRAIGKAAHLAAHYFDIGLNVKQETLDPAVAPYYTAYIKFRAALPWKLVQSEKAMYHQVHRYAGTPDKIFDTGKSLIVVEVKTAAEHGPHIPVQTAAQQMLWNQQPSMDPKLRALERGAVMLGGDGTFRWEPHRDPSDITTFLAALTLYNWRSKNGLARIA